MAAQARPKWKPEVQLAHDPRALWTPPYGLATFGDLFTLRQIEALNTFSQLVLEARDLAAADALQVGLSDDDTPLADGGVGSQAYGDAVAVYLAMAVSRLADYGSSVSTWRPKDNAMRSSMPKQAIQMAWDFAEGSPFGSSSSGFLECCDVVARCLDFNPSGKFGMAVQSSAFSDLQFRDVIISTDPPYFDNIGYADLSDFFYVWLRKSCHSIFRGLFSSINTPKIDELIASPYRHDKKSDANTFFLDGMSTSLKKMIERSHPAYPITIYYAYKQSESTKDGEIVRTGWDIFLSAIISSGLMVSGTWPLRIEGDNRSVSIGTNSLASCILLVCRPRPVDSPAATRRQFLSALKAELPHALRLLQRGAIAPVDLAQAAIGPGMAVFTRFARVADAAGAPLTVREALALINQTLDEVLAEQEGDFDPDTRFAIAWFEQNGFEEGAFGVANVLASAKNTAVAGLATAGILTAKAGKVRLLKPAELPADWDPATDTRLTVWECVHHLIRALETAGEPAAAALAAKLGPRAETARELAYRLYVIAERKKRAAEALSYNALVQSWREVARLAREEAPVVAPAQAELLL